MWIALRMLAAIVAYMVVARRLLPDVPSGSLGGFDYFEQRDTTRYGGITAFSIGVDFGAAVHISLHRERAWDWLFKALGLVTELQIGSETFDSMVYVACDDPGALRFIANDRAARDAVLRVMLAGFDRIRADGGVLSLQRQADRGPLESEKALLLELRAALVRVKPLLRGSRDPFFAKAAAVEGIAWSIFGYALATLPPAWLEPADIHLDPRALLVPGLILAAALLTVFSVGTIALMRGSARGHRIILECLVLLLCSLPIAGVQLVADLNRALDFAPDIVVARRILGTEVVGGRYRVHIAGGSQQPGEPHLPFAIDVPEAVFERATRDGVLEVRLGPGRFGYPWYREVSAPPSAPAPGRAASPQGRP